MKNKETTALMAALSGITDDECKALARVFEVAVSTPLCWSNGTAQPHPYLVERIIKFMHRLRA